MHWQSMFGVCLLLIVSLSGCGPRQTQTSPTTPSPPVIVQEPDTPKTERIGETLSSQIEYDFSIPFEGHEYWFKPIIKAVGVTLIFQIRNISSQPLRGLRVRVKLPEGYQFKPLRGLTLEQCRQFEQLTSSQGLSVPTILPGKEEGVMCPLESPVERKGDYTMRFEGYIMRGEEEISCQPVIVHIVQD